MSILLFVLIAIGISAVACIGVGIVSAVENIGIAKHTGKDPRLERGRDEAARKVLES